MSERVDHHKDDPPNFVGRAVPSGSGTETGWSVEARLNYFTPKSVAGMVLDDRWQTVPFREAALGVPAHRRGSPLALVHLYEYSAAQALRWWFIAAAAAEIEAICLETRLVKHKVAYSYSATALEAVEPANWRGAQPISQQPVTADKGK
jgi:hypothetical protein